MVGFEWSGLCTFRLLCMGWRPLCLLLTAFGSFGPPSIGWCGLVVSLWMVLVLSSACWMGLLGVLMLSVWCGFGFGCFAGILHFGPRNLVGFTVFWRW